MAKLFTCAFHRAFDYVSNVSKSLEEVIECRFQTVLTSGQSQNVIDEITRFSELVSKANNRVTIMPDSGLRLNNIDFMKGLIGATYFHSSAITDGSATAYG